MESSRRKNAIKNVEITDEKEQRDTEKAVQKEEARRLKKQAKRVELMNSTSYRMMENITKYLDKYYLDGIIGFIPIVGDFTWTVFGLPFIYFSLVRVKSIPLTLAVVFNVLVDCLLGMIPFFIGNVVDFFHRAYLKNMKLIVGYINDDQKVVKEVRSKATVTAILIVILCVLIYLLIKLLISLAGSIVSLFDWFIGLF